MADCVHFLCKQERLFFCLSFCVLVIIFDVIQASKENRLSCILCFSRINTIHSVCFHVGMQHQSRQWTQITFWSQCFHHFVGEVTLVINRILKRGLWSLCKNKKKHHDYINHCYTMTKLSSSTCCRSRHRGCLSPWLRNGCWTD